MQKDIAPIIACIESSKLADVERLGYSFEKRPIHLISLGSGPTVIFAWTQMHGNEATATAAVFDLLDILLSDDSILNTFTIHILPMLNPDGAERCIRQNAQGIDINRDATALQTPEGQILMNTAKRLKPNIGFNLHDQSPYYQTGTSGKPATIAFLAPAFDKQKSIDTSRHLAMQLIVAMNEKIQKTIPGAVARYDDTYSYRSFGDNIAGLGVSTILIESGAASGDPNRQIARKLNTESMLTAMEYLRSNAHDNTDIKSTTSAYESIPENVSEALSSLVIRELTFAAQNSYRAGVSIKQTARYSDEFYIDFVGDLGIQAGLQELDALHLVFNRGSTFEIDSPLTLDNDKYVDLIKAGYIRFSGQTSLLNNVSDYPVCFVENNTENALILGEPAYFLLNRRANSIEGNQTEIQDIALAVLNGQIIPLSG
ncbi:M14 family zinc carboxypeptidase [Glaciecola petra]|uniref:M14 family zinc carboxypeptidase n=1 Tax=Glaciecola petra TaxID=3075602 RepID=A0ABU2ZRW2_9ALTE|nr:M14 family zinc carboxypeptidase [Aestuariibacter sp. P117]MDT0595362.1 M14 family zinc carboxypeptidase [Aestuariibacter sp. P117]